MNLAMTSLSTLMATLLVATPLMAQTDAQAEKGLTISKESKARDEGWGDMQADMLMVLRNSQGEESIREIRLKSLEVDNDGDKSLSIFDKPLDVKGTAFLSFSHPVGADDQWLYLPALKRVKRIASRNKSGPFMGSEFSYEDLASFEIEKYTYKYIKDEACGDDTCFVVEQYPVDKYSGYTRRVVWIDQSEYRLQKAVFYDRKDALLKTLTYHDYQQYLDKYWRADLMKMVNHQTNKSTDLKWNNYQFKTGLSDSDFNKNTLKRAR
ncbi:MULTISPECIES: outer membrane lipoprotein-sorting protein [Neptunomonas]|uniref:Outer membrane lipoprotein-sorting protein n=1 Tax=Neptunomonas marina TaxID=1815562 RepID=A0A437QED4_9GAMM|nr:MULTISPECIES: outer membrane lipoprotein-sorting protein [Neptunomonas]RVU32805.1 outer membrane lipoprotein-sorting protein [Neptunomonas marina]